jgi:hypothetical protein
LNINDHQETSVTPFTYGELYRERNEEVKKNRVIMIDKLLFWGILALFSRIFS